MAAHPGLVNRFLCHESPGLFVCMRAMRGKSPPRLLGHGFHEFTCQEPTLRHCNVPSLRERDFGHVFEAKVQVRLTLVIEGGPIAGLDAPVAQGAVGAELAA